MPRARAVVLAAGHSTRMGHPKALTRIGPEGEAALARIVRACEDAGLPRPVIVLGAHHDEIRAALAELEGRVEWARNSDPDAGRTGSLQVGLALAPDADAILVWPVDHPLATAGTVRALLAVEGAWVVPTFNGRGGHPIVLRGEALARVCAAPQDAPLRELRAGLAEARVPVGDEGALRNLDRPEDVQGLVSPGETLPRNPNSI